MNPSAEIEKGERFAFGKNWDSFLKHLNEHRMHRAEDSLRTMLGLESLAGKRFLDIGSGSGLFSLAARRLGAHVHSFDYDVQSVACTRHLKDRFFPDDADWIVEAGSVLDEGYVRSLGHFDIVYSWGVLHHTGDMWRALENVILPTQPGGLLFIAIYNDQGRWSRRWLRIKCLYNRLPQALKLPYAVGVMGVREIWFMFPEVIKLRPMGYIRREWAHYADTGLRGMSRWHDLVDWVGGYPFEVAKPEAIFDFMRQRGWQLEQLRTCAGGIGCNEFVFARSH
ncbi:MAG: class I SAM-dependent methyltransferase [Acidiferrobacteraceae bacterium]